MNEAEALKKTGHFIVNDIRDFAIKEIEETLANKGNSSLDKRFAVAASTWTDETRNVVLDMLVSAIDTTLHRLMVKLEESDDIRLVVGDDSLDIKEISDGLAGEFVGWVDSLSHERGFVVE